MNLRVGVGFGIFWPCFEKLKNSSASQEGWNTAMEMIKKIMAAVDFSEYSLPTLRYALVLAQAVEAELVVVNIINERDVAAVRAAMAYSDKITVDGYIEDQKKERTRKVDELLEEAGCNVKVEKVFRVGSPASELLDAITETKVDLVLVGPKGRSNVAGMLFGSVAEKIHRRSPVSVLSVRGEAHAEMVCRLRGDA